MITNVFVDQPRQMIGKSDIYIGLYDSLYDGSNVRYQY